MAKRLCKKEVAERYGIKERTVHKMVIEGRIPFIRLTQKIVRFDEEALDRWDAGKLEQPQQ